MARPVPPPPTHVTDADRLRYPQLDANIAQLEVLLRDPNTSENGVKEVLGLLLNLFPAEDNHFRDRDLAPRIYVSLKNMIYNHPEYMDDKIIKRNVGVLMSDIKDTVGQDVFAVMERQNMILPRLQDQHGAGRRVSNPRVKPANPHTRVSNPWLIHVQKYRKKHPSLSYKEVLIRAKATYKK